MRRTIIAKSYNRAIPAPDRAILHAKMWQGRRLLNMHGQQCRVAQIFKEQLKQRMPDISGSQRNTKDIAAFQIPEAMDFR